MDASEHFNQPHPVQWNQHPMSSVPDDLSTMPPVNNVPKTLSSPSFATDAAQVISPPSFPQPRPVDPTSDFDSGITFSEATTPFGHDNVSQLGSAGLEALHFTHGYLQDCTTQRDVERESIPDGSSTMTPSHLRGHPQSQSYMHQQSMRPPYFVHDTYVHSPMQPNSILPSPALQHDSTPHMPPATLPPSVPQQPLDQIALDDIFSSAPTFSSSAHPAASPNPVQTSALAQVQSAMHNTLPSSSPLNRYYGQDYVHHDQGQSQGQGPTPVHVSQPFELNAYPGQAFQPCMPSPYVSASNQIGPSHTSGGPPSLAPTSYYHSGNNNPGNTHFTTNHHSNIHQTPTATSPPDQPPAPSLPSNSPHPYFTDPGVPHLSQQLQHSEYAAPHDLARSRYPPHSVSDDGAPFAPDGPVPTQRMQPHPTYRNCSDNGASNAMPAPMMLPQSQGANVLTPLSPVASACRSHSQTPSAQALSQRQNYNHFQSQALSQALPQTPRSQGELKGRSISKPPARRQATASRRKGQSLSRPSNLAPSRPQSASLEAVPVSSTAALDTLPQSMSNVGHVRLENGEQHVVNCAGVSTAVATPSTTYSTLLSPPLTPYTPVSAGGAKGSTSKGGGLGKDFTPIPAMSEVAPESGTPVGTGAGEWAGTGHFEGNGVKVGSESTALPSPDATPNGGPTTSKTAKGRDKLARLRKRLKCCSAEQLVVQMLELVRTDAVSENVMFSTVASVDVRHLLQKCENLHYVMISELPRDGIAGEHKGENSISKDSGISDSHMRGDMTSDGVQGEKLRELDTAIAKLYRRNFSQYRTCVVSNGKLLQDAGLWKELISFCVGAESINKRTPIRAEDSLNKLCRQVWSRLEQYARKGVTEFAKSVKIEKDMAIEKVANILSTLNKLGEDCAQPFPTAAQMLRDVRNRVSAEHDGSGTRSANIATNDFVNEPPTNAVRNLAENALAPGVIANGSVVQNSMALRTIAHGTVVQDATFCRADGGAD